MQQVLEASKTNKDHALPDLQEALALTGMVAEHLASLPPPPPLRLHAPLLAAYEGQEVPPPPSVLHHRHRHDHPHGVVINSPLQSSRRSSSTSSPTIRSSKRQHVRCPS
jgi:hypothetical protein